MGSCVCMCVCVFIGPFFLPGTDTGCCHRCGSHLLKVHFIGALEVFDDATGSPQWNHDNIHIPVGAKEDRQIK